MTRNTYFVQIVESGTNNPVQKIFIDDGIALPNATKADYDLRVMARKRRCQRVSDQLNQLFFTLKLQLTADIKLEKGL